MNFKQILCKLTILWRFELGKLNGIHCVDYWSEYQVAAKEAHFSACMQGVKTVKILEYITTLRNFLEYFYLSEVSEILWDYCLDIYLSVYGLAKCLD